MKQAESLAGRNKVPALFLHIQRTAGTSLIELARLRYATSMASHGEWVGHPPSELASLDFVSGHFGHDFARHLMPGRYSFTFLRDPVARVLSMYRFCRTRDPDEFAIYRRAHELDLASFLEAGMTDPLVKLHLWNNEVWQLAVGYTHPANWRIDEYPAHELLDLAKTHLGEFSFIGFTEIFARDGRTICSALGLPAPAELPVVNASKDSLGEEALTPQVRQLLDDLTFLDRQLYQYAWRCAERTEASAIAQR
jgi:hypothetical protein